MQKSFFLIQKKFFVDAKKVFFDAHPKVFGAKVGKVASIFHLVRTLSDQARVQTLLQPCLLACGSGSRPHALYITTPKPTRCDEMQQKIETSSQQAMNLVLP